MVKLKGNDVVDELQIQDEALSYNVSETSPMYGKKYHRAIFKNKVFTVTPDIYKKWAAGELASFTIVDTMRTVVNPETNEATEIAAFGYGGSATWAQLQSIKKNESALSMIEKKAEKALTLTPEDIQALLEA